MYCDACGTQTADGQNFCRACGKPLAATPSLPPAARMAGHVRMLGILWLAISALRLLPSFFLMGIGSHGFHLARLPHFLPPLLGLIGGLLLLSAVFGLVTGWGLLGRQPWARAAAILLGCLALFDLPFGTALGIYTLWVMLAHDAGEYDRLSRAA